MTVRGEQDERLARGPRLWATLGLAATAAYCVVCAAMSLRSGRPHPGGGDLLIGEWLAIFSYIVVYPLLDPRHMNPRRPQEWLPFGLVMILSLCGLATLSHRLMVTYLVVFLNTFAGFLLKITDPAAHDELTFRWFAGFAALSASIAAGTLGGLMGLRHGAEWLTGAAYFALLGAAEWSGLYQRLLSRTPD